MNTTASTERKSWLKTWLHYLLWTGIFAIVCSIALGLSLLIPVIPDPTTEFLSRKGELASVNIERQWQEKNASHTELMLTSTTGLELELTIRIPSEAGSPLPVAVLLGGHRTGRNSVHLVPEIPGAIIVGLSYPFKELETGFFNRLAEIQQAVLDTTPAILLALDYLFQQPYVDDTRVELVGVSLGAFFVAPPAVFDQRVKRLWLVHGAGKPGDIFTHQSKDRFESPVVRWLVGHGLATLVYSHHLTPEVWVGKMPPRPVIVINARNDKAFPPSSLKALHQALQSPSEILWTEGKHVTPGRPDVIRQITELVFERIAKAE